MGVEQRPEQCLPTPQENRREDSHGVEPLKWPRLPDSGGLELSETEETVWVTVAEAAERVNYSQGYIRHLISRDRIPSKKLKVEVKVTRPISKRFVDLGALWEHKKTARPGRPKRRILP